MRISGLCGCLFASPPAEIGDRARETLQRPLLGRDLSGLAHAHAPLRFAATELARLVNEGIINRDNLAIYVRAVLGLEHDASRIDAGLAPYLEQLSRNASSMFAQPVTRSSVSLLSVLYAAHHISERSRRQPWTGVESSFRAWLGSMLSTETKPVTITTALIPLHYLDDVKVGWNAGQEPECTVACGRHLSITVGVGYLRGTNLQGLDLRGADLRGRDLRGANLREANLHGVDLSGVDLMNADLYKADLRDANLSGANLRRANLMHAKLNCANLSGADLSGGGPVDPEPPAAQPDDTDWILECPVGANLRGAHLNGANLSGANLMRACLYLVRLESTHLSRVDLRGSDLRYARLEKSSLVDVKLSRANLGGAELNHATLERTSLNDANLTRALLEYATLVDTSLRGACLLGAKLSEARFERADLRDLDIGPGIDQYARTAIPNVVLENVDLSGTSIAPTTLYFCPKRVQGVTLKPLPGWDAQLRRLKEDIRTYDQVGATYNIDVWFNHRGPGRRSAFQHIAGIDASSRCQKVQLMRAVIDGLDHVRQKRPREVSAVIPSMGDVLFADPAYLAEHPDFAIWLKDGLLGDGTTLIDPELSDTALQALTVWAITELYVKGAAALRQRSAALFQLLLRLRQRTAEGTSVAENDRVHMKAMCQQLAKRYEQCLSEYVPGLLEPGGILAVERSLQEDENVFALISADGLHCVLLSPPGFTQLVLGEPRRHDEGTVSWMQLLVASRPSQADAFVTHAVAAPDRGDRNRSVLMHFPLLHRPRQRAEAREKWHGMLQAAGLEGSLLDLFEQALEEPASNIKLLELEDRQALHNVFSKNLLLSPDSHQQPNHLNAAHVAQLRQTWQDGDNKLFAYRLLCMGALYTRYASSYVFGEGIDSPEAIRHYAEALIRKAHELDVSLSGQTEFDDWMNRLKGTAGAFACASVLYGTMQLPKIIALACNDPAYATAFNEVIPLAWR